MSRKTAEPETLLVKEYVKGKNAAGGDAHSIVCPKCRSLGPAGEKPDECLTCGTYLDYPGA